MATFGRDSNLRIKHKQGHRISTARERDLWECVDNLMCLPVFEFTDIKLRLK